jgi:hypothetical protein
LQRRRMHALAHKNDLKSVEHSRQLLGTVAESHVYSLVDTVAQKQVDALREILLPSQSWPPPMKSCTLRLDGRHQQQAALGLLLLT